MLPRGLAGLVCQATRPGVEQALEDAAEPSGIRGPPGSWGLRLGWQGGVLVGLMYRWQTSIWKDVQHHIS